MSDVRTGTPEQPRGAADEDESRGTVLVALAANVTIGVAKLVGGLLSGSSAMLAEAAHSVADTLNEVFLLRSLRVSRRPADARHPFGYGQARFFWSLMAAVCIFVAGSVFSVFEGVRSLLTGGDEEASYLVAYVVLLVAFLAEGSSWLRALRQLRHEAAARQRGLREHLRLSTDPALKTVLLEDSAAVVGICLAAGGLALHQVTGQALWDGVAAICIGLVLAVVAYVLGRENADLLLGQTARPELVVGCYDAITDLPEVERVVELLTMHLGPDEVLLAVRVDLRDDVPAGRVEEVSTAVEDALRERWPELTQVFLDATRGEQATADRTRAHVDALRSQVPARAAPGAGRRG